MLAMQYYHLVLGDSKIYQMAWQTQLLHDLNSNSFKGQLILKANCQVKDSSKKRTNEFVFTSMRRVFVCFLGESSARKKRFKII